MVFLSTPKNCFLEGLTRPSLGAYLWIRVAMTLAQQGMLIHWNDHNDNGDSSPHGGDLKRIMTLTWTIIKGTSTITTMPFWDERVDAMAKAYPQVAVDRFHIDILTAHFVQRPQHFDVVVASNLFGDILSDLGPACTGTIGIAPSANLNPERKFPSLFEPVHGSAPDIYGQNIANPVGMIWSGAMMLQFLGEQAACDAIMNAIEHVLANGPHTPDLGGQASTTQMGQAIAARI